MKIKSGANVTWTNNDGAPHTIKADKFQPGTLNKGESFVQKFDNPGIYNYFCGIHPSMKGKIVVE